MKSFMIMVVASLILFGCKDQNEIDNTPPKPPQGIRTVSMDDTVLIYWLPSQADDLRGYNVWVSDQYNGQYSLIGSTSKTYFVDYGVTNGVTYYYAVSAFDFSSNESGLSKDVVYDTPRPEGYNVLIYDTLTSRSTSGYSFSNYNVVNYDNIYTDFFFAYESVKYYLEVWSNADIQDMGYTSSLDEISSSPIEGWSPSGTAEAIVGHTYIIWTHDNHYAKVRVTQVGTNYMVFDWAYQTAVGNIELKVMRPSRSERKLQGHSLVQQIK